MDHRQASGGFKEPPYGYRLPTMMVMVMVMMMHVSTVMVVGLFDHPDVDHPVSASWDLAPPV